MILAREMRNSRQIPLYLKSIIPVFGLHDDLVDQRSDHIARPKDEADLWDALVALSADDQAALFAHCASKGSRAGIWWRVRTI